MNIFLFIVGIFGLAGLFLLRQKINTIEIPYATLPSQTNTSDFLIVSRFWDEQEPSYHRNFIIVGVKINFFGDLSYFLLHKQVWPFGIHSKLTDLANRLTNGEKVVDLNLSTIKELIPVRNEVGAIKSFKFMTA